MTYTFNLIQMPWIPVIDLKGRRVELGLLDTLTRAHELAAVETASPLEIPAIYRLLLAILHRNFDTTNARAWGKLWHTGCWDRDILTNYLTAWAARFDLFDPQRPFYQDHDNRVEPQSVARLYPGMAAAGFFNHAVQKDNLRLTPAEAVRQLLVSQTFGLPGICHPQKKLFYNSAPWLVGMVFFLEGDNLFQTLALNLLRYDENSPRSELAKSDEDRPNWEKFNPFQPEREQPTGYLDYLTWPNRRIWLIPEETEAGVRVAKMTSSPGLKLSGSLFDPMKHYRRDEKKGHKLHVLNESRALWRDSSTLLRTRTEDILPAAVSWVAGLSERYALDCQAHHRLAGYGLVSENAKVDLARAERIPVPLAYLKREELIAQLETAVKNAEEIRSSLYGALYQLASLILSPTANQKNGRKPLSEDIKNQLKHWNVEKDYWTALEVPFYALIRALPQDSGEAALGRWNLTAVTAGWQALEQAERLAGDSPAALRAAVCSRMLFAGSLKKKEFLINAEKKPGKETA